MSLIDLDDFTVSHNPIDRIEEVVSLGYSSEFIRMWQYYLCYCEGGFLERVIGNLQLIASRPFNRAAPYLS